MKPYFSISKRISAMVNQKDEMDEFGKFCMDEQNKKYPKRERPGSIIIDSELERGVAENLDLMGVRDFTALTTAAGLSKLLGNNVLVEQAEILSAPPVSQKVGMQTVNVGKSNYVIPREDTEVQADIITEGTEGSGISPTYDDGFDVTPTIYKAGLKVSKRFFQHYNLKDLPIPIIDFLLIQRIKNAIYRRLDRAIFYGSGVAPEPYGLRNNVNINSISGANFDRDKAIDLENLIELYNANDPKFYIMHPNTKKLLKKRPIGASDTFLIENNSMNDYPVLSSIQMDEGDIFHGGFSTVLIESFGPIEVFVNPYKDDYAVTILAWGWYCFTARTPKTIALASSVT